MDQEFEITAIRRLLAQYAPGMESTIMSLSPDEKLPIDSLGIVNFAVAIEDIYAIKFRPDTDDLVAIFSNLNSLQHFIIKARGQSNEGY